MTGLGATHAVPQDVAIERTWYQTTAAKLTPFNGWIMFSNSVDESFGAGLDWAHFASASAELHIRILVPPALLRISPSGTRWSLSIDFRRAVPVNQAVAEKPRMTVPFARTHFSASVWQFRYLPAASKGV